MAAHTIAGEVLWAALSRIAADDADDYTHRRARRLAEAAARHLASQLPPPSPGAPRALLAQAAAGGDTLWLGLTLLVLREISWDVVDLGAGVPLETLAEGALREQPQLVVLVGDLADLEPLRRRMAASRAELLVLPESRDSLARLDAKLRRAPQGTRSDVENLEARASGEDGIFSLERRLS
jgi:hypothetical protein